LSRAANTLSVPPDRPNVSAPGRDQIFRQQIRAAGIDGEVDAFGLVVAFCQRDVEAGELRLRQPFQAEARLGEGFGRGGKRDWQ